MQEEFEWKVKIVHYPVVEENRSFFQYKASSENVADFFVLYL